MRRRKRGLFFKSNYELQLVYRYLMNWLSQPSIHKNIYDELVEWVNDKQNLFDYTLPEIETEIKTKPFEDEDEDENEDDHENNDLLNNLNKRVKKTKSKSQIKKEISIHLNDFRNYLHTILKKNSSVEKDETSKKIQWLGELLNLNSVDKKILEIAYRGEFVKMIEALLKFLFDLHFDSMNIINHPGFLSLLLDIKESDFKKSMNKNSPLKVLKLIDTGRDGDYFEVSDTIKQIMNQPISSKNEFRRLLIGNPLHSKLKWNDFVYMETEIQYLKQLISHAIINQEKGMNILLYGIPGTGKTEFSQVLCNHLKIPLYRTDLENSMLEDEPSREDRICSMLLIQKMFENNHKKCCLLFDEAEDFFCKPNPFSNESSSKMFTNYLLENNPVPVIWTSNHVSYLDPAYIRRFTHIVHFKKMPKEFSLKLWKKENKKKGLALPLQRLKELNQEFDIAPSEITKALAFSAFTDQTGDAVESNLQGTIKAIRGVKAKNWTTRNDFQFVYSLIHTDIDLRKFVTRIQLTKNLNFSLCLYGEPGTGKSAFARELAEKLNLKVIQKRASEIQSMWVGGTEKNIAAAFEQAEEEKALLVFDEADSFLQDRGKANRSWEITQVNEMLTRMESHPLPFV